MQEHLDALREQLAYLRQQLDAEREANRENRRIIAGLVQRVPELEAQASPEAQGSPTAPSEKSSSSPTPPGVQKRSWWHRLFPG
jgi:hypothetical protein